MKMLTVLTRRNIKLFFKDKGMFFTSLITPLILLVLYATFLFKIYKDSFLASIPGGLPVPEELIDGCVGGQLMSSLLAVSCITVAFCANLLMVQDKISGARRDLAMSPVRPSVMALAYYLATLVATLIVCITALGACLIYLTFIGFYLSFGDVMLLLLDVFLLTMFGTALSSVINFFLSTQGQGSAVGTVVSAGYGFICGAYMPISSFSEGLQRAISFLPGTYGTSLLRNHAMRGAFEAMKEEGFPDVVVEGIMDSVDCNLYFFDRAVEVPVMYAVLGGATLLLLGAYVLMHKFLKQR